MSLRVVEISMHILKPKIPDRKKETMSTINKISEISSMKSIQFLQAISIRLDEFKKSRAYRALTDDRGDVPGWVLVVLMTTGLVTAIWTIAAPRLTSILKNSLDSMNGIR